LRVLSLFDGIACGRVALERIGVPIEVYYASEIDKYAIGITQYNYPNTIQLGDVEKIDFKQFEGKVDLLIGGSPCVDFSTGKAFKGETKGLNGDKSKLFWEFVRAIKECKPKYFLLENVKMRSDYEQIINNALGIEPILFDSASVSAQQRIRLYWTNIKTTQNGLFRKLKTAIPQPNDMNILLKDIVLSLNEVDSKYIYDLPFEYLGKDKKIEAYIMAEKGFLKTMREVYNLNNKCGTLMTDGSGGNRQKKVYQDGVCRKLTPLEYERLQTLPDNYTEFGIIGGKKVKISDSQRYNTCGNGWTVDIIAHIFSYIS